MITAKSVSIKLFWPSFKKLRKLFLKDKTRNHIPKFQSSMLNGVAVIEWTDKQTDIQTYTHTYIHTPPNIGNT